MLEPAKSVGIEGMETDISFYTALHLTLYALTRKNLAVPKVIKAKPRLTPIGMYRHTSNWFTHIHISVGFVVARLDDRGHARAFTRGKSDKRTPHVVSFYTIHQP